MTSAVWWSLLSLPLSFFTSNVRIGFGRVEQIDATLALASGAEYVSSFELFDAVEPDQTVVSYRPTKVEIKLKKVASASWPTFERAAAAAAAPAPVPAAVAAPVAAAPSSVGTLPLLPTSPPPLFLPLFLPRCLVSVVRQTGV